MIYYRTFWDTGKNFGKAINREMELIPNSEDWVCLRDGDTLFLTDYWGKQIEDIIFHNGNHFDIIGGMLSRCNVPDQLLDSKISENYNLVFHREVALMREQLYYDQIKPTNGPIAAACMLFQKKTWEAIKFQEYSVHFDSLFCGNVRAAGGRLGIAQGLYLAHCYRMSVRDPGSHYKHLI